MTTIQDIADKLGISKSAVSKALNNAPDISETLQKQVLETAVELGYTKLRRYKKPVGNCASSYSGTILNMRSPTSSPTILSWDSARPPSRPGVRSPSYR